MPEASARYASPSSIARRKNARFSSWVCRVGRKSRHANDGSKIETTCSTSSPVARRITRRRLRAVPRDRDEPVRLTKIYTRGGDAGQTSLGDGSRTSKLDPRIRAYGVVDELNSQLGVVLAAEVPDELLLPLARIQNQLFDVGADLSVPFHGPDEKLRATQSMIDELEALCDEHNEHLPELKSFILPGGSDTSAGLHVARTIA